MKGNFLKLFKSRRVDYSKAVDTFFMSRGIACICVNVKGMEDIISPYSVPGYEVLCDSLTDYIDTAAANIPVDVPAVIEFCGHHFSDEEKKTVSDAVWNYYELELGKAQKIRRALIIRIVWFVIFFIFAAFLVLAGRTGSASKELLYVLFYFLGDRMIDYLVFGNREAEHRRLRCAQLVCMKAIFRDTFIDEELSEAEAEQIKSDISNHAKSREI